MAVDIGPRIGVTGEAEYRKQLNAIITQTKTLHAEMRTVESSFDKSTSAQDRAAKKAEVLARQLGEQQRKVDALKKGLAESAKKFGENDEKTLKWRQALYNAQTELNNLQTELDGLPNKIQALGMDMEAAGEKIKATGQKISSVGSTLSKSLTVPIMAAAAAVVKVSSDFDTSMSRVAAVSGATAAEMENLRDKAREMGETTKFSASDAGDAMNYMAMAGWKSEEMLNGIEGIMHLAAASGEELATASDIVTDALTAFGKTSADSGKLADIMAAAAANANTNVSMMGETFKKAAPAAGALKFSMEDVALLTGLMANAGIKASDAGIAMRRGFTNLVKPTKQMSAAMDKYGISLTDSEGNMKSLRTVIKEMRQNLGGLSETEQANAAATIFGANAYTAWLAVINGTEKDFTKLEKAIDNSAGTAEMMAGIMQDNLAGQMTILKSQLEELGISFGEVIMPMLRDGVKSVQEFVDELNDMDDAQREQIVKWGLIAAAAGPVLVGVGKMVTAVGSLVSVGGKLVTVLGGSSALLAAAPYAAAAAGVLALSVAVKALKDKYGESNDPMVKFGSALRQSAEDASAARDGLTDATKALEGTIQMSGEKLDNLQVNAELARQYGEELIALSSKSGRTAEEQFRMEEALAKLKAIYPEFTGQIDEATGALNLTNQEILAQIDNLQKLARQQAIQEIYADLMEDIVKAEKKRAEAQVRLDSVADQAEKAQNSLNEVEKARIRTQEELTKAQNDYNKALQQGDSSEAEAALIRMTELQGQLDSATVDVNGTLTDTAAAANVYSGAQEELYTQTSKTAKATKEADAQIAAANEELESLKRQAEEAGIPLEMLGIAEDNAAESADGMADATEGAGDAAAQAAAEIDEASEQIIEDYQSMYDKAYESAAGQMDVWDEMKESQKTSIEEMRTNLDAHLKALSDWNSNVQVLMNSERYANDTGFQTLVNSIISAGQEAAPQLAAITEAFQTGSADLEAVISSYGSMQDMASDFATYTANAEIVAKNGLDALELVYTDSSLPTAAGNMAQKTSQALINNTSTAGMTDIIMQPVEEMKANTGEAQAAAEEYADAFGKGIKEGDTKADQISEDFIGNREKIVQDKINASNAAVATTSAYASGIKTGSESVKSRLEQLREEIKSKLDGMDAYSWGAHLMQNFAQGMKDASGAVTAAASNAATSVADYLKHTVPKKGPLADDDVWGLHLVENFADGMKAGNAKLTAATASLGETIQTGMARYVDPQQVSGRAGIDPDQIYAAVKEGAEAAETTFRIGNREFARTLREMGVK